MLTDRARPTLMLAGMLLILVSALAPAATPHGPASAAAQGRATLTPPPLTDTATLAATTTPSPTPEPTAAPSPTPEPASAPPTLAPAPQQAAGLQLAITKTLEGSDLIQVGQYLTFTVRIRNTGSIVITTLPLIDEYDASVLQPARFDPAPSSSSSGRLDWADLTALPGFGDLPPGGEFVVTTVFRAIRISGEVINRARVEAAVGAGGQGGAPIEGGDSGAVRGGSVTVEKTLVPQPIRADAPALTWVITVRNDGFADLVSVPVEDDFDPSYLRYLSASPPADRHDPASGLLSWDNLIGATGLPRLRPGEVTTATVTFAVLGPIDNLVVNRIAGGAARDEFGNAVEAPRQADVRIRVVGVADQRPTFTPLPEAPRERRTATPAPTAAEAATATVLVAQDVAPATAVVAQADATPSGSAGEGAGAAGQPASLPATSAADIPTRRLIWLGVGCILLALLMRRRGVE